MIIALGCDHAAYELKEAIKAKMENEGHTIIDVGTYSPESVDYPKYGHAVGKAVASGEAERGIAVCESASHATRSRGSGLLSVHLLRWQKCAEGTTMPM